MRFQKNQPKNIEQHKTQSLHYFENALNAIQAGNAEKAGEFLWGSMAQALKAVAARKGVQLNSHGQLRNYASQLAKELGDESIAKNFRDAESLHRNFYEFGFELEDVRILAEDLREAVSKLLRLAEEAA
jgi:hypothetical protein